MAASVVGIFHVGVKQMCDFYQLQGNHVAEFSYMQLNNFTIRFFTMMEEEIKYPLVYPKQTVIKVEESHEYYLSPSPGFARISSHCDEINLLHWLLRLTKSATTGKQPLVCPI
ncbi:hypothetical protein Fmac_011586 [Flemingia macrophylla]|uniref:Uncharacterized protein n=1 Tax=Flemingia macrophylla TaxID=520843 RepID=A0ABD1MMW8_9FABA